MSSGTSWVSRTQLATLTDIASNRLQEHTQQQGTSPPLVETACPSYRSHVLTNTRADDWKKHALGTINAVLDSPLQLRVVNVVGGSDQPWAVLELEADGTCKNGMKYPQRYAWFLRFDEEGTIVQVCATLSRSSCTIRLALSYSEAWR